MIATEAAPHVSESKLIETLREFIHCSQHSRSVESRWLCTVLEPLILTVANVRHGGLNPEERKLVNEFRADELRKQIDDKRRDMNALAAELHKIQVASCPTLASS